MEVYTYSRAAAGSVTAVAPLSRACCTATVRCQAARLAAGVAPFRHTRTGQLLGSTAAVEQDRCINPAGRGGKKRRASHPPQQDKYVKPAGRGGKEQRAGHPQQYRCVNPSGKDGMKRRARQPKHSTRSKSAGKAGSRVILASVM